MDKLHLEHDFIQALWKYIKDCEQQTERDEKYWRKVLSGAENLSAEYGGKIPFADEWISLFLTYMKENA